MKAPLFRPAAIAAQCNTLYGDTSIARGPRTSLLVVAALLAVLSLIAFAVWGQYTRKEHVLGYLAPTSGLIKVYTPQTGTVLEKRVSEGQAVRQGDVLMVISSERSSTSTRDAQAAVLAQLGERRDSLKREQDKQAQIDQLAAASVQQRIRGLSAEIEQARAQLELQRSRVASAETTIKRYEGLVASRFMSDAALQQKQEELLDQRGQFASLQRSIAALTRDLDAARTELAASSLKQSNNSAQLERQVSELQQQLTETDSRRTVVLTATADGVVTTILADVGQSATTSAPLMSILPAGASLEAQLLVPTRAAGFIKPGQKVALRYQAFPYQRFGHHEGEVTRVGRSVIQPNETSLPVAVNEPVYRVTVKLPSQGVMAYGQAMNLQSGMGVDADIWLDTRRVIEWFFEPILSVTGRV
ncbi:HlyD family secretion protein [Piscinibacter terrae]|uniref:HlyD family efflux transporter periplasmic adaptor subunit n=1 Tax=Piscinibacter terrae TaxID=2496871 RepID=A0A3N7HSG3_9BURK|nr:HlyD family efflux transporter periplasmic adaptor subunit [Albitalea terrae]RQP25220.1 HlyD family efflux transporter periplasmic adaptor subunit [Albitalea terrae]